MKCDKRMYMETKIERSNEIDRGNEDTKKERGDEIERGWGLGHGERNKERGRVSKAVHCVL